MARSQQAEALRGKIDRFLRGWGLRFSADDDGDFMIPFDNTITWIRAADWEKSRTLARIWSITNVGMRVDGELTNLLVTTNATLVFGGFRLDEAGPAVVLVHTLLGEYLNRAELEMAVKAVVATAERFAPEIKQRFGGKLFTEK